MRADTWRAWGAIVLVMSTLLFMATCDKNATEPEETFDVTNDNEFCGMVAGYIRSSAGTGLSNARISISPAPATRLGDLSSREALSDFINYPNPFTMDTYFAYYLTGTDEHTMTISVYDLQCTLLRRFAEAPGTQGAHLIYFDGLDDQNEPLPEGLILCEVVAQGAGGTDSLGIALAKGINISDQGGLESYTVTTASDGKYIIGDVPLNIRLLQTATFTPQQELTYPENWPYVETGWTLTDRFLVSASKTGYTTVNDTVTLSPGGVTRQDFTLR
jgi:hypothetical protein